MKLTNWIFFILIIAALVWTGCSKSESHASSSIKTNETNQTNTVSVKAMHAVDATEHDHAAVVLTDNTPVLPLPINYSGQSHITGFCSGNNVNMSENDHIKMYWKAADSIVFEVSAFLGSSNTKQTFVYYADMHVLPGTHLPITLESARYVTTCFTLYTDSLALHRLVNCSCPDYVTETFSGVKQ
jgi:hypothetical protein